MTNVLSFKFLNLFDLVKNISYLKAIKCFLNAFLPFTEKSLTYRRSDPVSGVRWKTSSAFLTRGNRAGGSPCRTPLSRRLGAAPLQSPRRLPEARALQGPCPARFSSFGETTAIQIQKPALPQICSIPLPLRCSLTLTLTA